jgi:hypothetical protein
MFIELIPNNANFLGTFLPFIFILDFIIHLSFIYDKSSTKPVLLLLFTRTVIFLLLFFLVIFLQVTKFTTKHLLLGNYYLSPITTEELHCNVFQSLFPGIPHV